jgi:predicted nuclease of predicted toxin-antitoxin system
MTFLVDEDLPRSAGAVLREFGHEVIDVRDIGLRGASDSEIARYAQAHQLCLLTADGGFADVRHYPPAKYSGLVVLNLPMQATSSTIQHLLRELLSRTEILAQLSGRLVILAFGHIRLR